MTKKLMGTLVFSLSLAACAGTMHVASVSEAFKKYEQNDYEATLRLVDQAESTGKMTDEQQAQLIYLKALAYEGLGESELALSLFTHIAEQHPTSQYAYLSRTQLTDSGR